MTRVFATIVVFACFARASHADLVPPVHPIQNGSDHSNEDHTGHIHSFVNVNAPGASFRDGGLMATFSNLSGADLRGLEFDDVWLTDCNFSGANFSGSDLHELTGDGSDFSGAIFRDDVYGPARFDLTFLYNTSFRGVDFSGFDISDVWWDGADLRGANLRGAKINNKGPEGMAALIFDATTTYDAETIFPPGFDPVAAGLTMVPEPSNCALVAIGGLMFVRRCRNFIKSRVR